MEAARSAIAPLTSLRFFAAVHVLLFHSGSHLLDPARWPAPLIAFLRNGYLGVSFFFVLSGFILTYSYAGRMAGAADVKDFAVARFARIYPVYAVALLLYLPISEEPFEQPLMALATVFMVQGWTPINSSAGYFWNMPAWTLSMEFFFYLLFPLILMRTETFTNGKLWAGLAISAALVASLRLPPLHPDTAHLLIADFLKMVPLPLLRLPEFVLGIFAARLFLRGNFRWMGSDAVGFSVVVVTLAVLSCSRSPWVGAAAALCFAALIVAAASNGGLLSKALSVRWLVLLGGASYGIYLLQTVVRAWIGVLFQGDLAWTGRVLYQPVLLVVAIAVFLLVEEPARRAIRSRLSRRRARTTGPATSNV